jgi:uncharacterized membrane protein
MPELPLHPKLIHLPIALAVLMPLLTSGLLLAWWRGWFRQRTWTVVLLCQALLFTAGYLATRSGHNEEERVERVVPEAALEQHEEAAEAFQLGAGVVLALCLLPLLLRKQGLAQGAALAATLGTGVVLWLGFRVGEAGGELVYRYGAASAYGQSSAGAVPSGLPPKAPAKGGGDDDDR